MKYLLAICALGALLPLSACNRAAEAASAEPAKIELPMIAAGKWQARIENDGSDWGIPDTRCYPARSLWEVMDVGVAGLKSCKRSIEKQGAEYVAQYACKSGGSDITIKATISGDFGSYFTMESVQTFKPALNGTTRQTITVRAERHNDC